LFVSIGCAIVCFFAFFSTTRKAESHGVLLPTAGVIRIQSGQAGIIGNVRVREGQRVRKGEILFILSSERSDVGSKSAEGTVSALLQSRLDSFNDEMLQSRVLGRQRWQASLRRAADLVNDVSHVDGQIALQLNRVALAEQSYKRYSELQATSYISAAQLQEKQAELLDQRQRLADLQRVKSAGLRELVAAQAEARDLQVMAQREAGALERNVSALKQDLTENEARREIFVRAPQDGMVTAITADTGQAVGATSRLAAILPAGGELEAELYAPSRSAGFIKPGMKVLLRYQAYPYQKFGQHHATVREVANTSLRMEEFALTGTTTPAGIPSEPVYRIRLRLDKQTVTAFGKPMPLKSGMLVEASVVLEHRRLYEWALEPLFSISGRI
jgi:membrane fusion protein